MYAPLLLHVLFTDIYLFYTFTRVQILFFFFLFYFFTPFELHHLSTLIFFLLLLLIAKIPLFHSLSLIRIIGLLSSFIINSVLIITTKVHSTRSFRFDFIIIIIFFFSTNEPLVTIIAISFFNNVNCTRAEKFPDLISYISSLCYPIIQNSSSKNSQYDCSKEFPSP